MNIDEFRQRERPSVVPRGTTPELRAIAQDVVRMSALTGNESFDWYNRFLEAAIKAARRHLDQQTGVLQAPFSPDEAVRLARIKCIMIEARIEALTEVLMLPKFLLENSAKARAQIDGMERDAA